VSEPGRSAAPARPSVWKRRAIIGVAVLVLLVAGYFFATSFLPRWWSHRVGSQANGTFRWGVFWGLFYGVVCTVIAIVVARQAIYRQLKRRARVGILVVALLIASPNLMTLGISWGSGNGAHAGQRTLDDQGPGFRGATLIGFIIGLAIALLIEIALHVRRKHANELGQLRVDKKIRDAQDS
jgi:hypothetical protein